MQWVPVASKEGSAYVDLDKVVKVLFETEGGALRAHLFVAAGDTELVLAGVVVDPDITSALYRIIQDQSFS
ncbi:hypothetical protein [Pyrinomonas methylaliphatogenes]|jgi:hypothetical protein|uniref:Uncharacterized protein n=1 Tax=Pyrinomonas methylaliphatogenes TaxID=454194 RepID=A0A0B6WVZ6_9BACT|nr:hypothetical protein [Pyrinomonas methylaliphatogenes]MBX5479788.1 hypothetical protein [Pyrinomonas methylaliphatogenes]CDM64449.1 hypothetical protein PYK22_00443 [Pyrinomonas methylaliphatogenes]